MLQPIKKKKKRKSLYESSLSREHYLHMLWRKDAQFCQGVNFFWQEYALHCHHTFEKTAVPTCSAETCPAVDAAVYLMNAPIFTPSSWPQFHAYRAMMDPHPILRQQHGTCYFLECQRWQHVSINSSKRGTEDNTWTYAKVPKRTNWDKWLGNQVQQE